MSQVYTINMTKDLVDLYEQLGRDTLLFFTICRKLGLVEEPSGLRLDRAAEVARKMDTSEDGQLPLNLIKLERN